MAILWIIFSLSVVLFLYHHVFYPVLLQFAARKKVRPACKYNAHEKLPKIGILMCAYNEEKNIRAKIANLAMLDYPSTHFAIHIGLDGCSDNTEAQLNKELSVIQQQGIRCYIDSRVENRGKVATLNGLIEANRQHYDILLFTDVSALLSMDALRKIAAAFVNPMVGVVSGDYQFLSTPLPEQQRYWQYQNKLRQAEGAVGSVIGVPGAMYAVTAKHVERVPADTINDDFVLPMRILEKGFQAIVDPDLGIVEVEEDSANDDRQRRLRIGAGNLQQLLILRHLINPKFGWTAFNFVSGKALRAVMPLILLTAFFSLCALSAMGHPPALLILTSGLLTLALPSLAKLLLGINKLPIFSAIEYIIVNYFFALRGIGKLLLGHYANSWSNAKMIETEVVPLSVRIVKRIVDIVVSATALVLLSPIMLAVALMVKLSSPGPALFKQCRVGKIHRDKVELFYLYKFRSMLVDAEKKSGPMWSTQNDPRVTPVGRFIRKTRLDELPQLWNVLIGEMSLIGPRPERPQFHKKLEYHIPLFCERTVGVKPGITGLAQVKASYANDVEGMKEKLQWDMTYHLCLTQPLCWLRTESYIFLSTIKVMLLAKGQW